MTLNSAHYTSCPSGWEKWNSNCYLLQTGSNKMAFQDAESSCVGHGGHLASIVSNEELQYIQVLIADYHKCGNDYWTADDDSQICYYYSTEKVDWFTAKASCEESSSSLTTIKSKEKNTKLLSLGNTYIKSALFISLFNFLFIFFSSQWIFILDWLIRQCYRRKLALGELK